MIPLKRVCILGYGDIGKRMALALQRATPLLEIVAVSRTLSSSSSSPLQNATITFLQGDLNNSAFIQSLPPCEILYYLIPPLPVGEEDSLFRQFLQFLSFLPQKIVYMSTTGVYGDCQGAWINEETPVAPQNIRAKRRLDAEKALQVWAKARHCSFVILRVAGIYGPGRLPVDKLKAQEPVLEENHFYTNRIHSEDLASICVEAAFKGEGIYNVSDGHPSSMKAFYDELATQLQLPLAPTLSWSEAQKRWSPLFLSFFAESRRISTDKIQKELGVSFQYPTFKEGLKATLKEESYA
jgi:nucleoside-diphosphate-sugar epimerase